MCADMLTIIVRLMWLGLPSAQCLRTHLERPFAAHQRDYL
jgi:hypothetical protein